ncbi:MAG: polysaccharide deacetylase family protein [Alphaproteobacteria bacterium]|nr:polysaccharide deacetylase family protein [Alphaproteobacteria bacterium]
MIQIDMDKKLFSWGRAFYPGPLILLVLLLQHCLPIPGQPVARAADDVERPAPPKAGSERQPPSFDKPFAVEVPILVYHHIRQPVSFSSRAERRLTVTPEVFDRQMKYLQENGYHVIPFASLVGYLKRESELPDKPVIISFDDGWEDQFVNALPRLEEYHYNATFFVITNFIDAPGFLSWPQLRRILAAGMEIGSHTRSHPRLDKIKNPGMLWDQIYASKQTLESQLGAAVEEFAYPFGSYNAAAASMVRSAGYSAARACCIGRVQSDAYALRAVMAPNDLAKFGKYLGAPPVSARARSKSPRGRAGW